MKKIGLWVVTVCLLCSFCACQAHQPNAESSEETSSSSEARVSSATSSSEAPASAETPSSEALISSSHPAEAISSGTQPLQMPEPLAQQEKLQSIVRHSALSSRGTVRYWRYYRE